MPQIATLVTPALVPATPAPTPGPGGTGAALPAPDAPAADFLTQLVMALGALEPAGGLPMTPAPAVVSDPASPPDDAPKSADAPPDPKPEDLAQLLAQLGVLPVTVPVSAPMPQTDAPVETQPVTSSSEPVGRTLAPRTAARQTAEAAPPPAEDGVPPPAEDEAPPPTAPVAPPTTAPVAETPTTPTEPHVAPPRAEARHHLPTPVAGTTAPSTKPASQPVQVQPVEHGDPPQDTTWSSDGGQQPPASDGDGQQAPATASEPSRPAHATSHGDGSLETAPAANASPSASGPAPAANARASLHSADVVPQIAHQADLYRLPGNKGVRIQLRPEELGGVQVTLRYAAGGMLELHVAVEHASTGALVQAGWSQLRDALATQGIAPERLVMSVSGPSGGSLDLSSQRDSHSSGGGGRPDAASGMAAFAQGGQSGQPREDRAGAERPGTGRGWLGSAEAIGAADDDPSPTFEASRASASRIDYRV